MRKTICASWLRHTTIFLWLGIALTACVNKTNEYFTLEQATREFGFKVGSYWIYRNTTTGQLDSFVVTNNYVYSQYQEEQPEGIHHRTSVSAIHYRYPDKVDVGLWGFNLDYKGVSGLYLPFRLGATTRDGLAVTVNYLLEIEIDSTIYTGSYLVTGQYQDTLILKPMVGCLRMSAWSLDSPRINSQQSKADYRLVRYDVQL